MSRSIFFACLFLVAGQYPVLSQAIIPQPVQLEKTKGLFTFAGQVSLKMGANKEVEKVGQYFKNYLQEISGMDVGLNQKADKVIEFLLVSNVELGAEGYLLSVKESAILISANTAQGLFYGVQSLIQCLPAIRTNESLAIPAMEIKDYPRFKWRGMMLDVGRHFFSTEFIKEFIDLLASYKMNTFHWHLTEDQGWRIEIKKYPKLTQVGGFRKATTTGHNKGTDGLPYGGYYTQDQIRDIVRYASERHVTIVPEIELPGHSSAAIAAYPELSCFPSEPTKPAGLAVWSGQIKGKEVQQSWGVFEDVYCPTEFTFKFIQDVMDEVLALFPGPYIHVGGDECPKESWKRSEFCQQLIKEKGLKDEHGLQSYFIQRVEQYLNSKGRRLIGWDEILEGGLAPNASVMSWRGETGGIEAAKMKHDVVMTPGSPVYFDHYQGDPATEPMAIGGFNTLKRVYHYEPIPKELSAADAKYVLGAQANLWTEYIPSVEQAEYMILPRMLALSEVVWSPEASKNWTDFNNRLKPHLAAFESRGIRFSQGNFKVEVKPNARNGKMFVELESERSEFPIYYTLDGSTPSASGFTYKGPIELTYKSPIDVKSTIVLKAILGAQIPSVKPSLTEQQFTIHKGVGYQATYQTPESRYYPGGGPLALTDGIRGSVDHGKFWHAFNGNDMIATLQFDVEKKIQTVELGTVQNYGAWIFLPSEVVVEVSADGVQFNEVGRVRNTIPNSETVIKNFKVTFNSRNAKAIRVTAKNGGACPPGHPGEGKPSWIFVDEIVID